MFFILPCNKMALKAAHYILLCIYILSYYLNTRDNQLWCCGEAGISWCDVGIIDILENTK
jgi:hypothetical protein